MPWSSLQWLVHLIEAAAAIVLILGLGATLAVAAFWTLSRLAGSLAGPQPEEPERYEPALDPMGGPVILIQPAEPAPIPPSSNRPPPSC